MQNPAAYRLYMLFLKRHAFSHISGPSYQKILKSIDDVLQLSQVYGHKECEPGVILVEFLFFFNCVAVA